MNVAQRLLLFTAPIALASVCKATIASAVGGAELAVYQDDPLKLLDISIDLLLTATAVLLGVLLYVRSGVTMTVPGGRAITASDLVICSFIQVAALILIFASILGLPHIP